MSHVRRSARKPINRLAAVLGVATVWTVNPTNLQRCTDGDWLTPTGVGTKVMGGAGNYGQLDFDMGAVYNVLLRGKIMVGDGAGGATYQLFAFASEDGINFYGVQPSNAGNLWIGGTDVVDFLDFFLRGRYIRLVWYVAGATTCRGSIYELQALDLGL